MKASAKSVALFVVSLVATCFRILKVEVVDLSIQHAIDFIPPYPLFFRHSCRVLVLNQDTNYHYEVLESILSFYPLPQISACSRSNIYFTFAIASGEEKDLWRDRSISWYTYATQRMKDNTYTAVEGQSRVLQDVIRKSSYSSTVGFDYQIRASCYCHKHEDDMQWLYEKETHFCVFHEDCNRAINSSRAVWLHPSLQPSFFPSLLPQFDHPRDIDPETHHLCVVGAEERREYDLVAYYLWNHPFFSGIHFHHFGLGNVQKPMEPFYNVITLHPNPNFTEYQLDLYETCDAILSLVTRFGHPNYFEGPTKLTGVVVQAAAYQKPILLHEDLADLYGDHLVHMETHDDDVDSFSVAFDRLLRRLDELKAE